MKFILLLVVVIFVTLVLGASINRDDSGQEPLRSQLELEIRLNCEDSMRRTAERTIGSPKFDNMFDTEVGFELAQDGGEAFGWVSSFVAGGLRYDYSCVGTGRGNRIENWRLSDVSVIQ